MKSLTLGVAALAIALIPSFATASCISGTASVVASSDPAFDGYWEYTVEVSWDSPKSLSHLNVYFGLEGLICACDPGLMTFADIAGQSVGTEDGVECSLDYAGEYLCHGDPSLPAELGDVPAVKFEPISEPCDAGSMGSGTFVFYSLIAPAPESVYHDALVVKNGNGACTGDISGFLPAADCALPVEAGSWGSLKSTND